MYRMYDSLARKMSELDLKRSRAYYSLQHLLTILIKLRVIEKVDKTWLMGDWTLEYTRKMIKKVDVHADQL